MLSTDVDGSSGHSSMTRLAVLAGDHRRCSERGRYREARDDGSQPTWIQANRGAGQLRPTLCCQDVSLSNVSLTLYAAIDITHVTPRYGLVVRYLCRDHLVGVPLCHADLFQSEVECTQTRRPKSPMLCLHVPEELKKR
jgi:hypothetical protein